MFGLNLTYFARRQTCAVDS